MPVGKSKPLVTVSSLVSYFNNGTAVPMTALIGGCGLSAFLAFNILHSAQDRTQIDMSSEHISIG